MQRLSRLLARLEFHLENLLSLIPGLRFFRETRHYNNPRTFRVWFWQKVLGFNRHVYWPCHRASVINGWRHVSVGVDTAPGYAPGCYIQGVGKIYIGNYTNIAQNVAIISSNHDPYDGRRQVPEEVRIGDYCWIGFGAVILPGVVLGDHTVVGAGSVVTKPFPEGRCVIAGNPAKLIRTLEPDRLVRYRHVHRYRGYFPPGPRFEKFFQWNVHAK